MGSLRIAGSAQHWLGRETQQRNGDQFLQTAAAWQLRGDGAAGDQEQLTPPEGLGGRRAGSFC